MTGNTTSFYHPQQLVVMDLNAAFSELDIAQEYTVPSLPETYLEFSAEDHRDDEIEEVTQFCPFMSTNVTTERVLSAEKLSSGSDVKEIYGVEFSHNFDSFRPGDTIGIVTENRDADLKALFSHLGLVTSQASEKIKILKKNGVKKKIVHQDLPFLDKVTTLYRVFKSCLDVNCTPRKILVRVLARYTENEKERKFLEKLCSVEGCQLYTDLVLNGKKTFLELILRLKSCRPPAIRLIENLPKLLPRPYSIASSPLALPDRIRIVFSVVDTFERGEGLCTGMLKNVVVDKNDSKKSVKMYLRKSNGFNLPEENVPLVLVGPGTGIAPFIGFLEHRQMERTKGKIWLFYGCRYKSRDYLFEKKLNQFLESQTLEKLCVAFSRDAEDGSPKYVQDNLRKHGDDVCHLIEQGGRVYVCGDARNMSTDVFNCFVEIFQRHRGMTTSEAVNCLKQMQKEKRYLQDVWM